MKLKTVRISYEYVIAVPEGSDETDVAISCIPDVLRDEKFDYVDLNIRDYSEYKTKNHWGDECCPYGIPATKTLGELKREYSIPSPTVSFHDTGHLTVVYKDLPEGKPTEEISKNPNLVFIGWGHYGKR